MKTKDYETPSSKSLNDFQWKHSFISQLILFIFSIIQVTIDIFPKMLKDAIFCTSAFAFFLPPILLLCRPASTPLQSCKVKDTFSRLINPLTFSPLHDDYFEGVSTNFPTREVRGVAIFFGIELFLIPLEPAKVVFLNLDQSTFPIIITDLGDAHQITVEKTS